MPILGDRTPGSVGGELSVETAKRLVVNSPTLLRLGVMASVLIGKVLLTFSATGLKVGGDAWTATGTVRLATRPTDIIEMLIASVATDSV